MTTTLDQEIIRGGDARDPLFEKIWDTLTGEERALLLERGVASDNSFDGLDNVADNRDKNGDGQINTPEDRHYTEVDLAPPLALFFLHPSQRRVVDQFFNGPARVSGSAGTGKTVVAIHRAANILKKNPDARLPHHPKLPQMRIRFQQFFRKCRTFSSVSKSSKHMTPPSFMWP